MLVLHRILVDTRAEKFNFGIFRSQESSLRERLWRPQWYVLVLESFCFYIQTYYVFMCVICILEKKCWNFILPHSYVRTFSFFLLVGTAAATSLQHFPFGLMVMNEKISRIFFLTVYTNMMMTYTKVMSFFFTLNNDPLDHSSFFPFQNRYDCLLQRRWCWLVMHFAFGSNTTSKAAAWEEKKAKEIFPQRWSNV